MGKDGKAATCLRRGNYDGSSQGMEASAAGWADAKRWFHSVDPTFRAKVVAVCGDQDSALPNHVADCFPGAEVVYDPGHYAKTIRKAMEHWIPASNPLATISGRLMQTISRLLLRAKELAAQGTPRQCPLIHHAHHCPTFHPGSRMSRGRQPRRRQHRRSNRKQRQQQKRRSSHARRPRKQRKTRRKKKKKSRKRRPLCWMMRRRVKEKNLMQLSMAERRRCEKFLRRTSQGCHHQQRALQLGS